jgi:ammonia channel protein AmtB
MKFSAMLIFFFLWHCWVYCPVANWHWGGGFLAQWGILDFAGGSVVHIVGGILQGCSLKMRFYLLVSGFRVRKR